MFGQPLPVGPPAPAFTACTHAGETVSRETLRGRWAVLVFYPADDTPGCTAQLCGLRDNWLSFAAAGAAVYGVNPASAARHRGFLEKLKLPFPLIVDQGGRVARVFRAGFGPLIRRTVYVIDPEGRIAFARRGAPAVEEILAVIRPGAESPYS